VDAVTGEQLSPGPNFVTNMVIPAFKILFGHDELRRRYRTLKEPK